MTSLARSPRRAREPARLIGLWLVVLLTARCSGEPSVRPAAPRLAGLPVVMTVKQRSTTVVPVSGGAVRLKIDDITRGQVLVTLLGEDSAVLLGETSLTPGGSAGFQVKGEAYRLTLKALDQALVGEDFGTFEVSAAATSGLSEEAKIERLLAIVRSMKGAKFVRNDAEHSPQDAADHLRSKWKRAGERVTTAEEFVDRIATRSSGSGEPYRIRFMDGTVILAGDYLRQRLAEIGQGR